METLGVRSHWAVCSQSEWFHPLSIYCFSAHVRGQTAGATQLLSVLIWTNEMSQSKVKVKNGLWTQLLLTLQLFASVETFWKQKTFFKHRGGLEICTAASLVSRSTIFSPLKGLIWFQQKDPRLLVHHQQEQPTAVWFLHAVFHQKGHKNTYFNIQVTV